MVSVEASGLMILYLNLEKDRIEAILKRADPSNPFKSYCEEIQVPDDFNILVEYTNDDGESRKREMTVTELQAALTYREKRWAEYPSAGEQFDMIYHQGVDAWKAMIDGIKAKYPKPT